jgi:muramoyltetrapeptide carboxypeptidase
MAAVDFANDIDSTTEKSFWEMLTGAANETTVKISDAISHDTRRGGVANGRLLGGNLSLLAAMTGTPYFPDFTNAILMIEEVEEEPYRIDRMLTQLSQSGAFSLISGIVGGQFTGCIPRDPSHPSQSAEDILADFAGQHAVPYVSSAQFGHVPLKLTLPIGLSVRLNSNSGSLTFCESAVL